MTATKKLRPRRLASDEAHAWARNLKLGNIHAKLVLSMLTLYVDHDGKAFVGIPALAADCEMSTDTVRRRLVWLEEIGAIVRMAQWIDENGNRNSAARGKRSSDLIQLMIDADPDAIEARAAGDAPPETADDSEAISPSCQPGLNSEPKTVSPRPALGQPSHCGEGLISEPEPEVIPKAPLETATAPDGWQDFERDWSEPILRQSVCKPLWIALSAEQRQLARQAARGYFAKRKTQRHPPNVIGAQVFLRERDAWPGYAAYAPDVAAARSVFAPGSIEAKAIAGLHEVAGRAEAFRTIVCGRDGAVRWRKAMTPQLLTFAELPEASAWVTLDRNGAGAWERLMRELFDEGVVRAHFHDGGRAPWPFPPSSTGKIYPATAPPPTMSGQDEKDFT